VSLGLPMSFYLTSRCPCSGCMACVTSSARWGEEACSALTELPDHKDRTGMPGQRDPPALLQPSRGHKGHTGLPGQRDLPALLQPSRDRKGHKGLPGQRNPPALLQPSRDRKGHKGLPGQRDQPGRAARPGRPVRRDHLLLGAPLSIDPGGPARSFLPITALPCTPWKRPMCTFQSEIS